MHKYIKSNGQESTYEIKEVKIGEQTVKITVDQSLRVLFEKYRPREVFDLIQPKKVITKISKIIDDKISPNMVLYSQYGGSGKDSIIQVLKTKLPIEVTTYNASESGGISALREFTADFERSRRTFSGLRKALYLSETGEMTKAQLASLKDYFERNSNDFTFFITTNSLANMDTTTTLARFELMDLSIIPKDEIKPLMLQTFLRMKAILTIEGIKHDDSDLKQLVIDKFPMYREIVKALDEFTINGEFKYQKISEDVTIINEFVDAINNNNYQKCIQLSKIVEPNALLRYCTKAITTFGIADFNQIPHFIKIVSKLNTTIAKSEFVFSFVEVLDFASSCIQYNIKLNKVK